MVPIYNRCPSSARRKHFRNFKMCTAAFQRNSPTHCGIKRRNILFVDGKLRVNLTISALARQMSRFQELKKEISVLEKTFGPEHEFFRVASNGLDELICRFKCPTTNIEHVIHCNISVKLYSFSLLLSSLKHLTLYFRLFRY